MPKKLPPLLYGMFGLGLAFVATPVNAGFEWVAPDNNGYQQPATIYQQPVTVYQQPVASNTPSVSVATTAPEVISPVIISGGDNVAPRAVVAPVPAPSVRPVEMRPVEPRPSMATATIAIPGAPGDVVQGFASQIPLPLALRQLLPVGMNFSIDQSIDMETLVSYKGGKSWRETLSDMLATVGLVAREQGQTINVSHLADVRAPAVMAPVPMVAAIPTVTAVAPVEVSSVVVPRGTDMAVVNVGSADGWSAQRGDTLRKVLTEWCKREGVELQWVAEYDYPMEASASFSGGFEDAVRNLLAGFENARPQPVAELHTNPSAGQKILVVQARGNSYSN